MNAPALPLRPRLPAIPERRAALQTRLVDALNRRAVGGFATAAGLARARDRDAAAAFIRFRAGDRTVEVAPLLVDGAVPTLSSARGEPDAAAAAATLAPLEPLIAALELVLDRELHPAGLRAGGAGDDGDDGDALLIRLDAGAPGGPPLHRLLVAVPDDLDPDALGAPPLLPDALAALRLGWSAAVAGPAVALSRLGGLGRGDLLVLGTGPLLAQVRLPGRSARARVVLEEGSLVLEQDLASDGAVAADAAAPPLAVGADWAELRVATTVEMTGGTVSAAELATLGRGSVLPLDVGGGALPVRVLAGGRLVADGELVAVGAGFGVLVTAVAADGGRG